MWSKSRILILQAWIKGLLFILFIQLSHVSFAQEPAYDPGKEVTALVQVVAYRHTGHHIPSGNVTLKIEKVFSGIPEDTLLHFPGLENKYLIDKIFGQGTGEVDIIASHKPFVLKYTVFPDAFFSKGEYTVIWTATLNRKESLEKLETLIRSMIDKSGKTTLSEFTNSPLMALKNERYGRLFFNYKETNYVYIETYPGSTKWILAIPDDGYTHSRSMPAERLKLEKEGRIFYEENGVKKVAHRQNPGSDYWFIATVKN